MVQNLAHEKLLDDLLFAFGSLPEVRVWKRVVGVARHLHTNGIISFGIKGESDIQGIIAPSGRLLSIEVKTGKGVLSKEQKNFKAMIEKFGGLFIEARNVDDSLAYYKANK